jgi:hypothetical protein
MKGVLSTIFKDGNLVAVMQSKILKLYQDLIENRGYWAAQERFDLINNLHNLRVSTTKEEFAQCLNLALDQLAGQIPNNLDREKFIQQFTAVSDFFIQYRKEMMAKVTAPSSKGKDKTIYVSEEDISVDFQNFLTLRLLQLNSTSSPSNPYWKQEPNTVFDAIKKVFFAERKLDQNTYAPYIDFYSNDMLSQIKAFQLISQFQVQSHGKLPNQQIKIGKEILNNYLSTLNEDENKDEHVLFIANLNFWTGATSSIIPEQSWVKEWAGKLRDAYYNDEELKEEKDLGKGKEKEKGKGKKKK